MISVVLRVPYHKVHLYFLVDSFEGFDILLGPRPTRLEKGTTRYVTVSHLV